MRICMVFYDMQVFGGLEEYAINLAISLKKQGHPVSILSFAWVPPDNQYVQSLRRNNLRMIQLPKWISLPASDWPTKEKVLSVIMWLLAPLSLLLSVGVVIVKRRSPWQSFISAHHWLRGKLISKVIGPDWRKPFAQMLLNWWQLRWHPDIFHIQGYTSNLLFVLDWAHAKNIPVVYEEHQTPDPQFDWWKDFKSSINKAARVVAVSEKSAQALRDVCGVTRPIVVRNPLFTDPSVLGWKFEDRLRRTKENLTITTVARLYVTKGLKYLLEAIVQVNAVHPGMQFKVFGDGPLRQELVGYARQLGLDGEDIFAGAFTRQDLTDIMNKTDLFVLPSILEGQPLAVVEAMAYGCPIIATTVGGIPELIQDAVNGLLCAPADPSCLAEKICQLVEDPSLRLSLGKAARSSYEHGPFQPDAVGRELLAIYSAAIAG